MRGLFFCLLVVIVAAAMPQAWAQTRAELDQLVQQLQTTPSDSALRERIIATAQGVKPAPIVPEPARQKFVEGMTLSKVATDQAAQALAIQRFTDATNIAPWWGDAYYNLAILQELTGALDQAQSSLKLYLLTKPNETEAREAQDRIYALNAKKDLANATAAKAAAQRAAEEQAARDASSRQAAISLLQGTWYARNCQYNNSDPFGGCTEAEASGTNWYRMDLPDGPIRFTFKIQSNGTVQLNAYESWAECIDRSVPPGGDSGSVWGVAQGPSLTDVRWEFRGPNAPPRQVYSEINNNGTWMRISCDRPLVGANPNARYHYVTWTKSP